MKKIFVFDMDGTIINDNKRINESTYDALTKAKEKGHKLVIATGRPLKDALRDINKDFFDYLILNNGAYIYDVKEEKVFNEQYIPISEVKKMLEISKKVTSFFAMHHDGSATRSTLGHKSSLMKSSLSEMSQFEDTSVEEIEKTLENSKVSQTSLCASKEVIDDIYASSHFDTDAVSVCVANEIYLDINKKGVSKITGIKALLDILNMPIESTIAFGDSGNDMTMIEGVHVGVAMGNSIEELKAKADMIIGDNKSDAIAQTILSLI